MRYAHIRYMIASPPRIWTIPTGTTYVDCINSPYRGIRPGDIIEIEPGTRNHLWLANIIGTPLRPVIIRNGDGLVEIDDDVNQYGFIMENCRNFRFSGTGCPDYTYGIKVTQGHTAGILFNHKTDNFVFDHLEFNALVRPSSLPGSYSCAIMGQTMTTSSPDYDYNMDGSINSNDGVVTRASYTANYYVVHTCKFDGGVSVNAIDQGLYMGNHNWVDGDGGFFYPEVRYMYIYNNIFQNLGYTGFINGSVVDDMRIYDNYFANLCQDSTGHFSSDWMAIGIATGCHYAKVYNNYMTDVLGTGIVYMGEGGYLFNNAIIRCGRSGTYSDAGITVWYPSSYSHSGNTYIMNNTIVDPVGNGVEDGRGLGSDDRCQNNIIVNPGDAYTDLVGYTETYNLKTMNIDSVYFTDHDNDDYTLQSNSPAKDAGMDASAYKVLYDALGISRPRGTAYDQGCYEFTGDMFASDHKPAYLTGPFTSSSNKPAYIEGQSEESYVWDYDFEGGTLGDLTQVGSDISVTTAAKLNSTNYGISVLCDDTSDNYVYPPTLSPANTSGKLRARLYFDPNSLSMSSGQDIILLIGRGSGANLFLVTLLYNNPNYLILTTIYNDASGYTDSSSYTITDASHRIEVYLQRATGESSNDGSLALWIDGTLKETLSGVDNYTRFASFNSFRLGAIGKESGITGTFYLDELKVNDTGNEIGA